MMNRDDLFIVGIVAAVALVCGLNSTCAKPIRLPAQLETVSAVAPDHATVVAGKPYVLGDCSISFAQTPVGREIYIVEPLRRGATCIITTGPHVHA